MESLRQAVLIFNLHIKVRCNSHHRDPPALRKHIYTRIQDRLIPTELVDNQPFNHLFLILVKQHQGSQQLGENAASVNVPYQQYRGLSHLCHPHIDDIVFLQINLGRASRPLDHDNIIRFLQLAESLLNIRYQLLLIGKILSCAHVFLNLAIYDHLGAHVIGWL